MPRRKESLCNGIRICTPQTIRLPLRKLKIVCRKIQGLLPVKKLLIFVREPPLRHDCEATHCVAILLPKPASFLHQKTLKIDNPDRRLFGGDARSFALAPPSDLARCFALLCCVGDPPYSTREFTWAVLLGP